MNTKTLKGTGQSSSRDNLVMRSKNDPYPGWNQSIYDDEGMWVETHFVWMHRVVAEEEILYRPLRKDEKVHHINMNKSDYDKENLWVCNKSTHHKAHSSFNKICKRLIEMNIVDFNKKTGKYYLKSLT